MDDDLFDLIGFLIYSADSESNPVKNIPCGFPPSYEEDGQDDQNTCESEENND